ncbi:MAG: hypothetical protein ACOX1V_03815 [Candidatus Iainarchaeum sp.]|jgi:hypothetical protein
MAVSLKVRKMFPKKGAERKALMFASNVGNLSKEKKFSALKGFLRKKSASERAVAKKVLRTYKSRTKIFNEFKGLVNEFRVKYPSFDGVIIFGGTVKKASKPTDLDFMFVGNLPSAEKKRFCELLSERTGIVANPFPVKIDVRSNPKAFDKLLSIPYLHSHREWTVQNFVGPISVKRMLTKSFKGSLKRVKPARVVN